MKIRTVSNQRQLWGAQQACKNMCMYINLVTPTNLKVAIELAIKMAELLNKGYTIIDQNNREFNADRCVNMVSYVMNHCIEGNKMAEYGIISLPTFEQRDESGIYTAGENDTTPVGFPHMGVAQAILLNIRNLFYKEEMVTPFRRVVDETGKAEICNHIDEYDEFISAGPINTKEYEPVKVYRCKLSDPLTVITDDIRYFKPYYKKGVKQPSIAKSFGFIKFIYSKIKLSDIDVKTIKFNKDDFIVVHGDDFSNFGYYLKRDSSTLGDSNIMMYSKLFSTDFDVYVDYNDKIKAISCCVEHLEDYIDVVGNSIESILEMALPQDISKRVDLYFQQEILAGRLALNLENPNYDLYVNRLGLPEGIGCVVDRYYEDSNSDDTEE